MALVVRRFDVFLVGLDPTIGSEIQKSRPCLIISPDEMNRHIKTVIIAPMTTQGRKYPTRVACEFQGKQGQVVLDQIRTVDKSRLIRKLGRIDSQTEMKVLSVLHEMFSL
jgi:mRNA interferase MazF